MASSSSDNPGTVFASAIDSEVGKFRELQESINQLRSDLQIVLGQATENEMVLQELQLIVGDNDDGEAKAATPSKVYKMIGPALIQQNADEAVQTVQKRLEFIRAEQGKLAEQISAKEAKAGELSTKIQQMQATLQQTTAQAVQAIAAEHQQKKQQQSA